MGQNRYPLPTFTIIMRVISSHVFTYEMHKVSKSSRSMTTSTKAEPLQFGVLETYYQEDRRMDIKS